MRTILKIFDKIIFILILVLVVVFCLNNNQPAKISLQPLPFEIESKMFIIVLLCFFTGAFIGFALCSISLIKSKFKNFIGGWKIKFLQKKMKKINKSNNQDLQNL